MSDPERQRLGRLGGLTSWDQTADRSGRMAHVRNFSPADDEWHARRLGIDITGPLTDEQQARIRTSKKLYYARLRRLGAAAVKRHKAEYLMAMADKLEREAAADSAGA